MGRWLEKIKNTHDELPTKLTEPTFVSFVSTQPSHFLKKSDYSLKNNQKQNSIKALQTKPLEKVVCNHCKYFIPDIIGDGAGIGCCNLGIEWTQELSGRMPLYRYANRHCESFSKLID